jgi:hypothetical protein
VGEKGGYCKQTTSDHPSTPFLDKSSAGYQLAPQQVLLAAPSKQEPPPVFNHSLIINITKFVHTITQKLTTKCFPKMPFILTFFSTWIV